MIGPVLHLTTTTRTNIFIRLFCIIFVLIQLNDSELKSFCYTPLTITKFNFCYTSRQYNFSLFRDVVSARYFWMSKISNHNYFLNNLNGYKITGSMVRGSNCDSHRNKTYKISRPALDSYYEEIFGTVQNSHCALFCILMQQ